MEQINVIVGISKYQLDKYIELIKENVSEIEEVKEHITFKINDVYFELEKSNIKEVIVENSSLHIKYSDAWFNWHGASGVLQITWTKDA